MIISKNLADRQVFLLPDGVHQVSMLGTLISFFLTPCALDWCR